MLGNVRHARVSSAPLVRMEVVNPARFFGMDVLFFHKTLDYKSYKVNIQENGLKAIVCEDRDKTES